MSRKDTIELVGTILKEDLFPAHLIEKVIPV